MSSDQTYVIVMVLVTFAFGGIFGMIVTAFFKCHTTGDIFRWQTIGRGDAHAIQRVPEYNKELNHEVGITLSNGERYVVATDINGVETLRALLHANVP